MKSNLHKIDRLLRLVFALLVGVYFYLEGRPEGFQYDLIFYSAILFGVSGIINICPLYKVYGISTAPEDNRSDGGNNNKA
ncbi:MAG: DUF2892 domain-containing protein [Schleiferiaceae bacterium]|nr:DUF2892 domain-containing protein [Schleiferiaceae bacterium]